MTPLKYYHYLKNQHNYSPQFAYICVMMHFSPTYNEFLTRVNRWSNSPKKNPRRLR